jgi:hypothetical protein
MAQQGGLFLSAGNRDSEIPVFLLMSEAAIRDGGTQQRCHVFIVQDFTFDAVEADRWLIDGKELHSSDAS